MGQHEEGQEVEHSLYAIRVESCTHNGWKPGAWLIDYGEVSTWGPCRVIYHQVPTPYVAWSKREAQQRLRDLESAYGGSGAQFQVVQFREVK